MRYAPCPGGSVSQLLHGCWGQQNKSKRSVLLVWINSVVLQVVYWGVEAAVLHFPAPIPREQCEDVIIFDNLKVSSQALATQGCITERKTSNKKQRALFNSAVSISHESSESHRVISTKYIFYFCQIYHKELSLDKTISL